MKLFSFWRSLATYRVRIALNLKGLVPDEVIQVNLLKGEQRQAEFRSVNPMMAIPALIDGDGPALFESLAIIEYLDETHPNPPLLPRDARGRARVRGLSQLVACDSHPLIVPRVREYLAHEFKFDEAAVQQMVPALAHRRDDRARDASEGQGHRPLLPRRYHHARRHLSGEPGRGRKIFQRRHRAVSEVHAHRQRAVGHRRLRARPSVETARRAGHLVGWAARGVAACPRGQNRARALPTQHGTSNDCHPSRESVTPLRCPDVAHMGCRFIAIDDSALTLRLATISLVAA